MKSHYLWFRRPLLALVFGCGIMAAQPPAPALADSCSGTNYNGCGGQGLSSYVPEYHFHDACCVHDQCYDTARLSREDCDREFLWNMNTACDLHPDDSSCRFWASTYHWAVGQFSENNYNGPPDPYVPDPSTITLASGVGWDWEGSPSYEGGGGRSSSGDSLWSQFDPNPSDLEAACRELEQIATEQCEGEGLVLGGFACFSETYGSAYCQTVYEQHGCELDGQLVAQYQEVEDGGDPKNDPRVWVCPY